MSTGVYLWSQTAASNGNIDPAINFLEGQAPSSVNDSARALMAAVAKWRDDNAGSLTATLSTAAYSITSNQATGGTIPSNFTISFRPQTVNPAGGVTLSVDGSTAHPLRGIAGVELPSNYLNPNNIYRATYISGSTQWLLHGVPTQVWLGIGMSTGICANYVSTVAPDGWVLQNGGTIGDASSSGTTRANADTQALFNLLWPFGSAVVSGGKGVSAAADFAAHKTIKLTTQTWTDTVLGTLYSMIKL